MEVAGEPRRLLEKARFGVPRGGRQLVHCVFKPNNDLKVYGSGFCGPRVFGPEVKKKSISADGLEHNKKHEGTGGPSLLFQKQCQPGADVNVAYTTFFCLQ